MGYPVAAGTRDMSSTTMRYIPALYAGKLLVKYYNTTVLGAVCNTEYEGEIKKYGDTVYIRSCPTLTIRAYVKGQTLVNEQPESTATTMTIDKGYYWSFVSEDLDKVQTDIKSYVSKWADDAAEQLAKTIDTDVLAAIPSGVHASNTGNSAGVVTSALALGTTASPVALTKSNILESIVDCGICLDEQNVPSSGRFLVLPPLYCGMIKKSDLKDASMTGDDKSPMRTGSLGMIDRFHLYCSNLLSTDGTYTKCIFGTQAGCSFATQLTESKVQDNPDGFGMLHRGLQVYGYKVTVPEAVGALIVKVG